METIIKNNLQLISATFDFENQKLTCKCVDLGPDGKQKRGIKSYYLKLDTFQPWTDHKTMISQVMNSGIKIRK